MPTDIFMVRYERADGDRLKAYARRHGLSKSATIRFLSLDALDACERPKGG